MDKHIVNDARTLALEAVQGLAQTRPGLWVDAQHRIITRKHNDVGIVSGGGSGHEPSFGGMVGSGLLSTAVAGNIFASPNVNQIRRGIQLAAQGKGVLIIIMR
jgi:dihydroxyacetone kinase